MRDTTLQVAQEYTPDTTWAQPTEKGLTVDRDPTYAEWFAVGVELSRLYKSLQWVIGDFLNYGEAAFGESYAQIYTLFEQGDVDAARQTLANWKSVAKLIPPDQRHPALSFSLHAAVASEEPERREALLQEAEERGYSVSALTARARGEDEVTRLCKMAANLLRRAEGATEPGEQRELVRTAIDAVEDAANFTDVGKKEKGLEATDDLRNY